uniref:Uncharacterized protein n=1 Tax=Aegilops tauschii subsp. strangulata TaxID=200361 RepID=A0A453Q5W0_AEGTS
RPHCVQSSTSPSASPHGDTGPIAHACADLGMYVEVSYRDVLLATSSTLMQQICAGPRGAVKHPFVARGAGVVIPGQLLDSLAMDMLSGAPEFDVKLHGPSPRKFVWPCGPRMVGDADALRAECGM